MRAVINKLRSSQQVLIMFAILGVITRLCPRHRQSVSLYRCFCSKNFVVRSSLREVSLKHSSLVDCVWNNSAKFENHVAIECAETGKKYTYSQLKDRTASFASSLHNVIGLKPGDVVAVMLPNIPEYPIILLGTAQAGCVLSTINPIYKEYEINHHISTTKPKVVITNKDCYAKVKQGLNDAKIIAKIIIVDELNKSIPENTIRFTEITENVKDFSTLNKIERKLTDLLFVPFSSGTTGLPKGVQISNYNILAGLNMMQDENVSYPLETTATHQDVVPCVLPFFHIYGMVVVLLAHLVKGCKLVTIPKFDPQIYIDVLKYHKASLLYVVPPLATLLSKHPDVGYEHLKHIRYLMSGAAPLSSSDVLPLEEKCKGKMKICQGFGTTETTSLTTCTRIGSQGKDYSASGEPLRSTELKFVGSDGKPVPIGEPGELLVRSPTVMKGYYRNETATKESFDEEGFYKTGDLGYYKPGVGLYIQDRIKELIKVNGMQVAPAELESLLRSHPDVQDAAVIGVPNEICGEVPKGFIIKKKGATVNVDDLKSFVKSKVAVFKRIETIQFVDEIPKTGSGKILRKEIKKLYA